MTTINEALVSVRSDIGVIGKAERNTQQGFMFRGVDTILNKVGPAMEVHGVNCYPVLQSLDTRDITSSKGTRMREVTVTVAYHYVGPEGDEFVAVVPGESTDAGDKAVSKAMSVALRTSHIQTFQIPTGHADPDSQSMTRGTDPLVKVKTEIWEEARKREWIAADDSYDQLATDFAEWSQGGDIAGAELAVLKDYLALLRPKKTMQRGKP
jgi:hypothetical protein